MRGFLVALLLLFAVQSVQGGEVVRRTVRRGPLGLRREVVTERVSSPVHGQNLSVRLPRQSLIFLQSQPLIAVPLHR
jgi:hypothetical protein